MPVEEMEIPSGKARFRTLYMLFKCRVDVTVDLAALLKSLAHYVMLPM